MLKPLLRRLVGGPVASRAWSTLTRGRAAILTLHRFRVPGSDIRGHDPLVLRDTLERLRRERYELIGLEDALRRLRRPGARLTRAVVFTVDDGYADFAQAGAGVFAAYDCPVTVFLTTGFVDGSLWFWWDLIDHVLATTRRDTLRLLVAGQEWQCDVHDAAGREAFVWALREHAQRVPDAERLEILSRLADEADVVPPDAAPAKYAAMSWPEVAALERSGATFGPHTVSHRTLTRLSDEDAEREIAESWRALRDRLADPVPVLAYPYGRYGERDARIAADHGLLGAVTTRDGYADRASIAASSGGAFELPRFGCPDDADGVRLIASGFERIAAGVRRMLPSRNGAASDGTGRAGLTSSSFAQPAGGGVA